MNVMTCQQTLTAEAAPKLLADAGSHQCCTEHTLEQHHERAETEGQHTDPRLETEMNRRQTLTVAPESSTCTFRQEVAS